MFYQWTTREKKLIVCIAILALLSISLFLSSWIGDRGTTEIEFALQPIGQDASQAEKASASPTLEVVSKAPEDAPNEIAVDIKGAVKHPNVYFMKEGMRVIDVIMTAGNLVEDGTTTAINLAQKLEDGMLIYIPTIEELEGDKIIPELVQVQNTGSTSSSTSSSGKININKASLTELKGLPGIGPSRAKAIITYREEKGKFSTTNEIMNISGIGPKIYENIKDLIEH